MSKKEYKEKAENCFLQNTVLINENEQLKKKNEKLKECIKMQENEVQELYESYERRLKPLQKENEELKAELEKEKKLNSYIKARFVECNTCTSDKKEKCLMFSENLCEGERCTELVDLDTLINSAIEKGLYR